MKKMVVLAVVLLTVMGSLYANEHLKTIKALEGSWELDDRMRLYQNSGVAPRAKMMINVPQQGSMIYEFTIRYEGGLEDGHGGVGIHILGDHPPKGKSWGMGTSWLLWLNYDVAPTAKGIPGGLSAQLYKSTSNIDMEIVQSISLKHMEPIAIRYLQMDIPMKLTYVANTGRVYIADPQGLSNGWYVELPNGRNLTGSFAAIRTNGMKVSFTSNDVKL